MSHFDSACARSLLVRAQIMNSIFVRIEGAGGQNSALARRAITPRKLRENLIDPYSSQKHAKRKACLREVARKVSWAKHAYANTRMIMRRAKHALR
jgi:hypothetical protein